MPTDRRPAGMPGAACARPAAARVERAAILRGIRRSARLMALRRAVAQGRYPAARNLDQVVGALQAVLRGA
jgi:hypothetical protein